MVRTPHRHRIGALGLGLSLTCVALGIARDGGGQDDQGQRVSFHRGVRPILQQHCQGCHQPAKTKGGVDLTSHSALMAGNEQGPIVVPGRPDESLLVEMITPLGDLPPLMPEDRPPLGADQIALLRRWIAEGAGDDTPAAVVRYDPEHPPVYQRPPVITGLDFSPDGGLLAVSGHHEVLLVDPEGGRATARLVGLSERIQSLRFSPDGALLAVAGGSPGRAGELQIWSVAGSGLQLSVPVTHDTLYGVSWSEDGAQVAVGCGDNTVRVFEVASGEQVLYQGAHQDWVLGTAFATDSSHLVTVSRDRSMKLTKVATQQFIDNITSITPGTLEGGLMAVDRHPQRDELLVGGADGGPKIFRMYREKKRVIGDDYNLLRSFEAMPGRIFAVRYSNDGSRIVAGSSAGGRGQVRVYQSEPREDPNAAGAPLWTHELPTAVYAVAFRPDGLVVAAAGFDGRVRLLYAADGRTALELDPFPLTASARARPVEASAGPAAPDPGAPGAPGAPAAPAGGAAAETLPVGSALAGLQVRPERIDLGGRFEYTQLLIEARLEDGRRVDATRMAELAGAHPLVSVSDRRLVRPRADGQGELRFTLAGHSVTVPVSVHGTREATQPSFVQDVMPLISRIGCNAGTCHGSAKGKNGFKLSLRGYDPARDHSALTDDLAARRFDRAFPERSLLLLKTTTEVPHEGGLRIRPGGLDYELFRSWITGGADYDADAPRVVALEIRPQDPTIPLPNMHQQVAVLATYADGRVRDVTAEAFVESGDIEVAEVDGQGLVTALRRGEAPILVRYEGRYAATRLLVMGDREGWAWEDVPEFNFVDTLVHEKLRRIRSRPSALCTDGEFLRRVHLDLTGLPPTARQVRTFLMDDRDKRMKREEQIDRLIGSSEFVDHWTSKWADLLQVNRKFLGAEGARRMHDWIRASIASNHAYDGFVREILLGSGSTYDHPEAAYYKILREPDLVMENTTQLFLGIRFNCNKCHDHPFERWTQDQHWRLAAFFAQVGRENVEGSPLMPARSVAEPGRQAYEEIIFDAEQGEVTDPRSGEVAPPVFPFEHAGPLPQEPRRARLAAWVTAPENPYFARSYVNRLWSYFTGVGLIEPVDDIRAGNPPSNPELLDRLTQQFVDSGFDMRTLMRTITSSRTYQLSVETNRWNEHDRINYSHALARRLPAEVLYDAVHRATGSKPRLAGVRAGTLASELVDPSVEATDGFLGLFGRPPRESACECERSSGMSLAQALSLVNGRTVAEAIRDPRSALADLVAVERDGAAIVEELYLSFLGRPPSADERTELARTLDPADVANRAALDPQGEQEFARRLAAWEEGIPKVRWSLARPVSARSSAGAEIVAQEDGSFLIVGGGAPEKDTTTLVVWIDRPRITGIRLEVLPDESLPAGGPGRSENGNFVLSELSVTAVPAADPGAARPLVLVEPTADFSQDGWPVANAIDGRLETGWAVMPRFGQRHVAVFEAAEDAGADGGTTLVLTLEQQFGRQHTIGRLRIWATDSERPVRHHGLPEAVAAALVVPAGERGPEARAILHAHFVSIDREMADRIRLGATQDLAWALANSPAFLFNR